MFLQRKNLEFPLETWCSWITAPSPWLPLPPPQDFRLSIKNLLISLLNSFLTQVFLSSDSFCVSNSWIGLKGQHGKPITICNTAPMGTCVIHTEIHVQQWQHVSFPPPHTRALPLILWKALDTHIRGNTQQLICSPFLTPSFLVRFSSSWSPSFSKVLLCWILLFLFCLKMLF